MESGAPGATGPGAESTLLSNLDRAPNVNLKLYASTPQERADYAAHGVEWSRLSQAFSTGPVAAGLGAVRASSRWPSDPGEDLALSIYSDIHDQPGVRLHVLDGPNPEMGNTRVFYAGPGAVLEALTTYHLVLEHQGGLLGIGSTRDPEESGRPGWSIAGRSVVLGSQPRGLAEPRGAAGPALFELTGYELPALPVVAALTATAEGASEISPGLGRRRRR